MKYRALLVGGNNAIINDFFLRGNTNFEFLCSSERYEDICNHIKYFSPHVLIFCMRDETTDSMKIISAVKKDKTKNKLPVVIIGSNEECNDFIRAAINTVDLMLKKPITVLSVCEQVSKFLRMMDQEVPEPAPVPPADAPAPVEAAPEEPAESAENEPTSYGEKLVARRKHILVVDDDSRMLKTIKRDLEDKYDVATAINGKVALKFLEHKTTDLILLDYEMPLQNGAEVLAELRSDTKTMEIPVVFLTGVNERAKIMQVLSLKPQGYLIKPVDRIKLAEMIKSILG